MERGRKNRVEKRNIVLMDNRPEEMTPFLRGLEQATGQSWSAGVCITNGGRKSPLSELVRYGKYFAYSFQIFRKRREYGCIVAWQAFYGLIFAFWCRLFRVPKENTLVVLHLTCREKPGLAGWLYHRFLRYILTGGYVDRYTCTAREHGRHCAAEFGLPEEQFWFLPFGVGDLTTTLGPGKRGDYLLSIGRSNRDWDFLIRALDGCGYPVRLVCDTLEERPLPENMTLHRRVWQEESWRWIRDCAAVVIPVLDSTIPAGETVLLQAMCFGKPVIAARSDGVWADYLVDGQTGLVVAKERKALLEAVDRLMTDPALYCRISENSRREYRERFSLEGYGRRTGERLKEALT